MSENTKIWDMLGRTDPSHTKSFKRSGGFSGTAIKPMWAYRRMTEEFGPAGKGWGVGKPSFDVVPAGVETLVYCTVEAWWKEPGDGEKNFVYGVGGDKCVGTNRNGSFSDDEAFKKAFTDALTNALKLIGVGADVHMGMFDDNKYVNDMKAEFANDTPPKQASAAQMKRGLEMISADLIDAASMASFQKLGGDWKQRMDSEGWTSDYRDEARKRFAERLDQIKPKDDAQQVMDAFPGSKIVDERMSA